MSPRKAGLGEFPQLTHRSCGGLNNSALRAGIRHWQESVESPPLAPQRPPATRTISPIYAGVLCGEAGLFFFSFGTKRGIRRTASNISFHTLCLENIVPHPCKKPRKDGHPAGIPSQL